MTKTPRLVLGTAQLGLAYGIANYTGMPEEADAVALIQAAVASGVITIDTARAYGDAERRIGQALRGMPHVTVVTKLDPLAQIPPAANRDIALTAARNSLALSRAALKRDHLDVVLLHRAEHLTQWNGAVWRWLIEEQSRSAIGQLGVSAQSPAEVIEALRNPNISYLQLPFNLLDWRWTSSSAIEHLRQRPDVTVDARSTFLQGLLVSNTARWPNVAAAESQKLTSRLEKLALETGRRNRADLCMAFVRAQDWIDGVVVGCETLEQLQDNLELFRTPPLDKFAMEHVLRDRPHASTDLLDPARWRR